MNGNEIRIAVLSDTHGLLRRCVAAEVQDCDCILHAGDIIRQSDLDELAVYGNLYADVSEGNFYSVACLSYIATHESHHVE